MTDPKALEELDLASRAIGRARALLAREDLVAAAAVPFDPWQPISTAPKDGSEIVGINTSFADSRYIVYWRTFPTGSYTDGVWQIKKPAGRDPLQSMEVTHWMSIPAPPGADANQQSKTGVTQASDSLARPSSSLSPAVRDVTLPLDRETLGRMVREAWMRWAKTQPNPKPSWLLPYDDLSEPDKEADRQIGEAICRWTVIHYEASSVRDVTLREALEDMVANAKIIKEHDDKLMIDTLAMLIEERGKAALSHPSLPDG